MRCSTRYVVWKEVFICAEESELSPKCYFVRGILSPQADRYCLEEDQKGDRKPAALTTPLCVCLFSQAQSQSTPDKDLLKAVEGVLNLK